MGFEVVVVFAVVVAAIVAYSFHARAKRRKELAAWARSHGLAFNQGKDHGFDDHFTRFNCLRQGSDRYAYNVMRGDWNGHGMTAFDYHYQTGSGKNRSSHYFSAVILESPIPLEPLFIRREGLFDKVTEFFGFDDIDFESAEFSRNFYVKSPDRKWAYAVIHARMMEYLMAAPGFSVQFDVGQVIAWRSSRFSPAQFDAAAEFIRGIYDRLPDYLIEQQKREA
ncbi:MAG: hypothetical protein ACYTF6_00325 [Planctomycetota bacterium]|jgi:hypothetical protein